MAIALERVSPLALPRRDFTMQAGDDVRLLFTLFQRDDGSDDRADLVGLRGRFWLGLTHTWRLWRPVAVVDYAAGQVGVSLALADTESLSGLHDWGLRLEWPGGRNTVARGSCQIFAPRNVPGLAIGTIEAIP